MHALTLNIGQVENKHVDRAIVPVIGTGELIAIERADWHTIGLKMGWDVCNPTLAGACEKALRYLEKHKQTDPAYQSVWAALTRALQVAKS